MTSFFGIIVILFLSFLQSTCTYGARKILLHHPKISDHFPLSRTIVLNDTVTPELRFSTLAYAKKEQLCAESLIVESFIYIEKNNEKSGPPPTVNMLRKAKNLYESRLRKSSAISFGGEKPTDIPPLYNAVTARVRPKPDTDITDNVRAISCISGGNHSWMIEDGYNLNQYFILASNGHHSEGNKDVLEILGIVEQVQPVSMQMGQDQKELENSFMHSYASVKVGDQKNLCTLEEVERFRLCCHLLSLYPLESRMDEYYVFEPEQHCVRGASIIFIGDDMNEINNISKSFKTAALTIKPPSPEPKPMTVDLLQCSTNLGQFYVAVNQIEMGTVYMLFEQVMEKNNSFSLFHQASNIP